MVNKYLLSCQCGEQLPIEPGQAGQEISCRCGRRLDVPTLRAMATLPQLKQTAAPRGWSRVQGFLFLACVLWLLTGSLATGWLWSLSHQDSLVRQFDLTAQDLTGRVETLGPSEAFLLWRMFRDHAMEMMTGPQRIQEQQSRLQWQRDWAVVSGTITALGLCGFAWAMVRARRSRARA